MRATDATALQAPAGTEADLDVTPAEERILLATTAALTRLDPAALTIKRICRAAEVTPPTLYYHFGNKDGLVAAAVERLVADWLAAMDAAVSRTTPLATTLDQAIAAWELAIVAPTRPLAVFSWATLLLADSSELARTALVSARDRGRSMIAEIVALHVPSEPARALITQMLLDGVIAAAVQYELDHDHGALRERLDLLAQAARMLVAQVSSTPAG